jgi:hypothetical protein
VAKAFATVGGIAGFLAALWSYSYTWVGLPEPPALLCPACRFVQPLSRQVFRIQADVGFWIVASNVALYAALGFAVGALIGTVFGRAE